MSDQPQVDLTLIARQQRQMLTEMATMRDDMGMMMAILQRLDGTVAGLVSEIRATHAQISRMDRRVREMEEKS